MQSFECFFCDNCKRQIVAELAQSNIVRRFHGSCIISSVAPHGHNLWSLNMPFIKCIPDGVKLTNTSRRWLLARIKESNKNHTTH